MIDCFGINEWADHEDFIEQVAKNTGKLCKGGEADYNNVCKQIITDWQRGRIPYHTKAPIDPNAPVKTKKEEADEEKLDQEGMGAKVEIDEDAEFEKDE